MLLVGLSPAVACGSVSAADAASVLLCGSLQGGPQRHRQNIGGGQARGFGGQPGFGGGGGGFGQRQQYGAGMRQRPGAGGGW